MHAQENKAYELWSQNPKAGALYISISSLNPTLDTHKDKSRHGGVYL